MDFFRGKHAWTKLWRLKDQLPQGSRYKAGLMADPEIAEYIVDHLDDHTTDADSFVDESVELQMLRAVLNEVKQLRVPILAPHMKRPPRVEPVRGPVPEWKRVQDRRDQKDVDDMLSYFGIK